MEVVEKKKPGRPAVSKEVTPEKIERVEGTKPGWKPASTLPNLKAPAGFTARWVHNEPGNVAKKLAEGWIMMEPKDQLGPQIRTNDVMQGGQLSNEIRYRDSIGMMLPNDLKEARTEYIRDQNKDAIRSALKDTDEKLKSHGVSTYTPKGQAGRIVIE